MKSFKEFYILNEGGRFRDSPNLKHEKDYPMFSIFTDRTDPEFEETTKTLDKNSIKLQNAFWAARREINKIGFPSMHANVIFKTIPGGYSGAALGSPEQNKSGSRVWEDRRRLKHMELNNDFLTYIDEDYQDLIDTIVHEWSHLWMFNHGAEFRRAMDQYYEALINSNIDKIKPNTSVLNYESMFDDILKAIIVYQKNSNIRVLNNSVIDAVDTVLQATGPFYKHIPDEFAQTLAEAIVGQIKSKEDNYPPSIITDLENMGIVNYINDFLRNKLRLDPTRVGENIKKKISKMVNFPSAYGLQDSDETFAVAMEKFNQLDPYHKKRIIELMQVR